MIERPKDPYETATGKKLKLDLIPGTSLYRIRYSDGTTGRLPDKYAGTYTSINQVHAAILTFVDETFIVAEAHSTKKKTA